MRVIEEWVASVAPNRRAFNNAKGAMGRFYGLFFDDKIIFGGCKAADGGNYEMFADLSCETPLFFCSCPSRQNPCKHVLALLLLYSADSAMFLPSVLPEKLAAKRTLPKKMRGVNPPSKAAVAARKRKAGLQVKSLAKAAFLLASLQSEGLEIQTHKSMLRYRENLTFLRDNYLSGVNAALTEIFRELPLLPPGERACMNGAIDEARLLCEQSAAYFAEKARGEEVFNAEIETWCGKKWKLAELESLGLMSENERLLQLHFEIYDNLSAMEIEETGYWINLSTGAVYVTKNLRPYCAMRQTKEDGVCHMLLTAAKFYRYPCGNRVRWKGYTLSAPTRVDYLAVIGFASNGNLELPYALRKETPERAVFGKVIKNTGGEAVLTPLTVITADGILRRE